METSKHVCKNSQKKLRKILEQESGLSLKLHNLQKF